MFALGPAIRYNGRSDERQDVNRLLMNSFRLLATRCNGKSGQIGLKATTSKLLQNKSETAFRKIQLAGQGQPRAVTLRRVG